MVWRLIDIEAAAWRRAGQAPSLWWRDDDARRPSAALDRLLDLSENYRVPVSLAIIPDVDLAPLAAQLRNRPFVRAIQHGVDHRNRNEGGAFAAEFKPSAPASEVAKRVEAGWARLSSAVDAAPIFAPPWNRITPNLLEGLLQTPIRAVSGYGAAEPVPAGLASLNAHLDVLRWDPPRFRGSGGALVRLWRHLRVRRKTGRWTEPIGLLTHHRNLDEAAWSFLEAFLARTRRPGSALDWRTADEILERGQGQPAPRESQAGDRASGVRGER